MLCNMLCVLLSVIVLMIFSICELSGVSVSV